MCDYRTKNQTKYKMFQTKLDFQFDPFTASQTVYLSSAANNSGDENNLVLAHSKLSIHYTKQWGIKTTSEMHIIYTLERKNRTNTSEHTTNTN